MKLQPSSSTIWRIALPIILAEVNETLVEVTDTVFLARFGTVELGAVALAATIYEVVVFFTFGLADSIQIVVARRAGEGRERGIGDAFYHGAVLLLATSVVLGLALKLLSPHLTAALLQSDAVRAAVDGFLGIAAFAVVFHCLNVAYSALYVGIGRTRVLVEATSVLAVTNVAFDYLLIFGHGGFPRLGIRGAAVSLLVSEIAACAWFTLRAWRDPEVRALQPFRWRPLERSLTRVMLGISWPAALERLIETARWFLFFVIVEHLGETTLAQANIVYSVYTVLLLPIGGFGETACTMVSNLIGQDDESKIGGVLRRIMKAAALLLLPCVVLGLALPELLLRVFTSDPEMLRGMAGSIRVVSAALLIVIPGEVVFSAVAGTGDTRATLLIELVLGACILLTAFTAGVLLGLPLAAIWAGEIVGWSVCLLLSYRWLRSGRWQRVPI